MIHHHQEHFLNRSFEKENAPDQRRKNHQNTNSNSLNLNRKKETISNSRDKKDRFCWILSVAIGVTFGFFYISSLLQSWKRYLSIFGGVCSSSFLIWTLCYFNNDNEQGADFNGDIFGIKNYRNNCYTNSSLQLLNSIQEFIKIMKNSKARKNSIKY